MNLRQQLVEGRVEKVAADFSITNDEAFMRLMLSLVTDQSLYAFDENDLVDGGQDKQIDTISIQQDTDEATIYIIQAKNSDSFSSNALIQMSNGLDWIFNKSRTIVKTLPNKKLKDRIVECRSVISGLGPSNVRIVVAFVTNGLTSTLSDEFKQEADQIREAYNNKTFSSFDLLIWGADETVSTLNVIERKHRKINDDVTIVYDKNTPSFIRYFAQGLSGVVCSVTARELARVVLNDNEDAIFDSNIRRFLGDRKAVNTEIFKTCTNPESSYLFWFLNNGVTIVCDRLDPVNDPDNPKIKLWNMQIVNGCQTATTLARAANANLLAPDARVLLRIYQTTDNDLVSRIVLTTNNQNKISNRDLRANDPVQLDMQNGFLRYGYSYEKKLFEFTKAEGIDVTRVVANEIVAQSYLAVVLKRPSDARRRKYKIWGELYDQIFGGSSSIEPYIISTLLFRLSALWLKNSTYIEDRNDLRRKLARNGAFHIARIASHLWRGADRWNADLKQLVGHIETLEKSPDELNPFFERAFILFHKVFMGNEQYKLDPEGAFKSMSLDEKIDTVLYKRVKSKRPPSKKKR